MKKRISLYLIAIVGAMSLQSCVSNYVVSSPVQYKTDAKLAKLSPKKIAEAKKEIKENVGESVATFASLEKAGMEEVLNASVKRNNTIDNVLKQAYTYLGTPYRLGGTTRSGIDCSAFVLSVYEEATGVELPRVAASQAHEGQPIAKENLQKGDLIFFAHSGRGRISHVGIVEEVTSTGEIKFIHASTSRGVMVSSLDDSYWRGKYRSAKRIISEN